MTTPDDTRSSRYESTEAASTAICISSHCASLTLTFFFRLLGNCVIYLDARRRFQRAQRFIASNHNLVAWLQSLGNFNVRHTADASFDGAKNRFLTVHHEHALHLFLLGITRRRRGRRCKRNAGVAVLARVLSRLFQVLARPHSQRLYRNGHNVFLLSGLYFCRGGKSGTQIVWGSSERDHYLEILSFLGTCCALSGGKPGAAQRSLRTNFGYLAFEYFTCDGVDGDIGILPGSNVYDVRFIDFHFRRNHGHVRQSHQKTSIRIL